MFEIGDEVRVVNFGNDYADDPVRLIPSHPYRKLGIGTCRVRYVDSTHVSIENLKNGYKNTIYHWRCELATKREPSWEV
jgi:hypothetical protein